MSSKSESKDPCRAGWSPESDWAEIVSGESEDIAAIYQAQQQGCPVAWREVEAGQGFWGVFRHDDVVEVLQDPVRFSSAVPKYGAPLIPIEVDPPEHGQYRQLLSQLINPARMRRFEPEIRAYVVELLESALASPEPDLLRITKTLPVRAFCLLVGEPAPDEWEAISQQREQRNENRLALLDPESVARRKAAAAPIADYCARQIALRRTAPGDDLVSDILAGQVDGRPVTDDEALRILTLVYIAGHRTTTAALGGAVTQLARNPDLQDALRADPAGIPLVLEEVLRLESPIHALPRYCTQDTVLGGRTIRKGDQVFPVYAAANVDPQAFPHPEQFDPERRPNRHLAFGRGIHVCAGAPLARLQLKVFVEELLARTGGIQLTGPVTRPAWPHYGPTTLPVKVTPAQG